MSNKKMTLTLIDEIISRMILAASAKNQQEMINITGLSDGACSKWRARESVPDSGILKVAEMTGCSASWIKTGEGEMLRQKESLQTGAVHEARTNHSFRANELPTMVVTQISRPATPDEQELLGYFAVLCEEQKAALLSVARAMAAGVPGKSPASDRADKDSIRKRSA